MSKTKIVQHSRYVSSADEYLSSGTQYRLAHLVLTRSQEFQTFYSSLVLPAQENAGFAFECFFKALLVHFREPSNFTGGKTGHDLLALMELCIARGCDFSPVLLSGELVGDVGKHHSDYSQRYLREANKYVIRGHIEVQGALERLEAFVRQTLRHG